MLAGWSRDLFEHLNKLIYSPFLNVNKWMLQAKEVYISDLDNVPHNVSGKWSVSTFVQLIRETKMATCRVQK